MQPHALDPRPEPPRSTRSVIAWRGRVGYDGAVMDQDRELEALRTQVANQAANLAQTVSEGFAGFHMGAGDYVVELMAPEGPSTGGGRAARQHLRLVPRRRGYPTIVVGAVDPVTSTGEVRTFDHVALLHELRFRRPLEINADEFGAFLRKVDIVMAVARVRIQRVPPTPDIIAERRAQSKISIPALVTFVVVLVLVAILAFRIARTLHPS